MEADLVSLALFVETVESGSITAGAQRRNLSLPAASARISALERRHGMQLLLRSRRGVTATAAGEVLARHARRLLAEAGDLERSMSAQAHGLRNEIRLASNTSAVDTLTEFLAAALARFPDTSIVLHEMSSTDAVSQVAAREADIAVISHRPPQGLLEVRSLWEDPLVVVGLPRDGGSGAISLGQILESPLIGLIEGSPLQALIHARALSLGAVPSYRVRLPSLSAVAAVAGTGAGPAIIPLGTARRAGIPTASLRPLSDPWARRRALLAARDFTALSPAAGAFADALTRYKDELIG